VKVLLSLDIIGIQFDGSHVFPNPLFLLYRPSNSNQPFLGRCVFHATCLLFMISLQHHVSYRQMIFFVKSCKYPIIIKSLNFTQSIIFKIIIVKLLYLVLIHTIYFTIHNNFRCFDLILNKKKKKKLLTIF